MNFSFIRRAFIAGIFCLLCISTRAYAQVTELKVAPWWYFQEQIENFFAGATQEGPGSGPSSTEGDPSTSKGEPPSPATETETEWIVKICDIPNPLNKDKTVCITLRINKRTGNVQITVDDFLPISLTYHIRCGKDGKCKIIDDLFPPFRTTFCEMKRDDSGAVLYVCRFNYFGISVDGTIKIYIEDGNLCLKVNNHVPDCRPFEELPAWLQEIWRDVNPLWLPPAPPAPMGGSNDPLLNDIGSSTLGGR